jgi:hypothetical protein
MPLTTITVHIDGPHIRCTEKGGNAHPRQHRRDQIRWVSENPTDPTKRFRLVFTDFDTEQPVPWPFEEAQPAWPTADTGPLTVHVPRFPKYIKYDVQVDGCNDLDPIIVVDN